MTGVAQIIDECFRPFAYAAVRLSRDSTDSFNIQIDPLKSNPQFTFSKQDVKSLLPSGSSWIQSLGWRSFTGIPFRVDSQSWLGVGVEMVQPHASRGAYPTYDGYILPCNKLPAEPLMKFLDILYGSIDHKPKKEQQLSSGIISGDAQTLEEHRAVEAWILRKAINAYEQGKWLLFRTLILSESQIPRTPGCLSLFVDLGLNTSTIFYDRYLVATVPAIRRTFAKRMVE